MSEAMNIGVGVGGTSSACLLLILGISLGNWLRKNGKGVTPAQEKAAKAFEWVAIFGKGGLIAALIALAAINGTVSYVAKNPTKFMQDALATGGFGALAAVFLTLTRGRTDLFFNHLIFAFMLFFLFHVCREFAGYFTIFGSEKKTDDIQKEQAKYTRPILIAGGVIAFIAIMLALVSRAPPDYTQGILKSLAIVRPNMAFFVETVLFVAIVTGGEIIVAKNHGDPVGTAIGTSAVIFTLAHLMLQSGGFYDHLYKSVEVFHDTAREATKAVNQGLKAS